MVKDFNHLVIDFDLLKEDSKYKLLKLCKHAGGSTHVTLTLPTYLVQYADMFSSSRSLLITLVLEDYFRREEVLSPKYPSLQTLLKYLLAMDRFAQKVKRTGGSTNETNRTLRAYQAYMRRFTRVIKRRMRETMG